LLATASNAHYEQLPAGDKAEVFGDMTAILFPEIPTRFYQCAFKYAGTALNRFFRGTPTHVLQEAREIPAPQPHMVFETAFVDGEWRVVKPTELPAVHEPKLPVKYEPKLPVVVDQGFQPALPANEPLPAPVLKLGGETKVVPKLVNFEAAEQITSKLKGGIEIDAIEARNLIKMSPEYASGLENLEQIVDKLNQVVSDSRLGWIQKPNMHINTLMKFEEEATLLYELFRAESSVDVTKISINTGIPERIIQQIKNHIFCDIHLRAGKFARFDASIDQAYAWQRLIDGNFVQSDLRLLLHEYSESSLGQQYIAVTSQQAEYRILHEVANKLHNWQSFVE